MSRHAPGAETAHAALPPPGGTGSVRLDHGRFLRLQGGAGITLTGVSGLLWVTRDGSWDDVLLLPGQQFRVPDDGPVLVSAFGPSVARVAVPPRAKTGWRRIAGLLRRRPRPPVPARA